MCQLAPPTPISVLNLDGSYVQLCYPRCKLLIVSYVAGTIGKLNLDGTFKADPAGIL